jgi:hypothetical protein
VLKEAAIESLSNSPSNVIIQSYNNYLQDPKITVLPIGFFVASPMLSTHVPSLSSYTPTDTVSSYNTHYPIIDYQLDKKHKHNVQNIIKLPNMPKPKHDYRHSLGLQQTLLSIINLKNCMSITYQILPICQNQNTKLIATHKLQKTAS